MRVVITSILLVLVVNMATSAPDTKTYYDINEAPSLFETFVKNFNREYKDEADKQVHYEAFKKSLAKINDLNAKSPYTTFGINKFADYTEEESKHMFGLKLPNK